MHKEQLSVEREQTLTGHQKAMFQFLEHLYHRETAETPNAPKVTVVWNLGETTEHHLKEIQENGYSSTLLDYPGAMETFEWYITEPGETKSRGSMDIRVFLDIENTLVFSANIGKLSDMASDWEQAVGTLDYPIEVRDRHGFVFHNRAHQSQKAS